jgi:predicted PurR-regulated permease PerM
MNQPTETVYGIFQKPIVRAVGLLVMATMVLWGVYAARAVLLPFLIAFAIAYMLDPVIDRMEAKNINRTIAILLLLLLLFLLFIVVVALAGPLVITQVEEGAKALPGYFQRLIAEIKPLIAAIPSVDQKQVEQTIRDGLSTLGDLPLTIIKGVTGWVWAGMSSVMGAVVALFNAIIIPVATFYLLNDFDRIVAKLADRVPPRFRTPVFRFAGKTDAALAGFFRGQMIVALTMSCYLSIGLFAVGTPMGLAIGLAAGMASIVPYLSAVVGFLPALLLTWLQYGDATHVALVMAVFISAQMLEGFVISPKVLEDAVGLHPVAVMAALLAGGHFLGFVGVVIAVPTAAVLKVAIGEADDWYLASDFYREEPASSLAVPEEPPVDPTPLSDLADSAVPPESSSEA